MQDNKALGVGELKALQVLKDAREQVERMLTDADNDVAHWIEQAELAGQQEGAQQVEHLKTKLTTLGETLSKEVTGDLIQAALLVANEIIQEARGSSTNAMLKVVQTALGTVSDAQRVTLRANPADMTLLTSNQQKLVDVLGRAKEIEIKEDRKIERSGVIIHTEAGVIDAQIKTQLEEIGRALGV